MASTTFILFTLILAVGAVSVAGAHNITDVLSAFPEYSQFNDYLTRTKLDGEINSRQTITVLALNNAAMSTLTAKHPISIIKNALSLHILLDYYDNTKLHKISDGTTLSTTLLQTSGNTPGQLGFVNITDLKGGKVGFGSAIPGSPLDSFYTKSVKQFPFNLSVIEINPPILSKAILDAPVETESNITALLEKAGCKTFASLIVTSGVIKAYESVAEKGLTVFAPNDEAFKAKGVPDLSKLSNAELVSLLQYHALASYTPIGSLKTSKDPISTLATNGAGKYDISVTTAGDSVTLVSGVDSSRVAATVIDSTPLCIFTVDNVLLPTELFGKAPSPAPGPAPEKSPAPAPATSAPESAAAPSPFMSPPAPPMPAPAPGPADGPASDAQSSTSDNNAAGVVEAPVLLLTALVTVMASVIVSVLLS